VQFLFLGRLEIDLGIHLAKISAAGFKVLPELLIVFESAFLKHEKSSSSLFYGKVLPGFLDASKSNLPQQNKKGKRTFSQECFTLRKF
jgi:hypothetical protein